MAGQKCPHVDAGTVDNEKPIWQGFTFHDIGLWITASFALIAVLIAVYLILQHALHYSKPYEQKHIIRILFMIPVYALISAMSYIWFKYNVYLEVIRDSYEAVALASFFTLLCHYVAPTLHDQKEYFRTLQPKNWLWPVPWYQKCFGGRDRGCFRVPKSGLTWFNINYVGIYQYCFIRVFFTWVSLVTEFGGNFCEESLSPAFSHIWVLVWETFSVSIAMYCLIQFYYELRKDLAQHKPFLKILCIKLVIFFSFWQNTIIDFISSDKGPLKETATIARPDIKVGLPSLLICVEMTGFAIMHIFAFPWKPYSLSDPAGLDPMADKDLYYRGGSLGIRALLDAANPWDMIKQTARGFKWLFVGRRHRHEDRSYEMVDRNNSLAANTPRGSMSQQRKGSMSQQRKGSIPHGQTATFPARRSSLAQHDGAGIAPPRASFSQQGGSYPPRGPAYHSRGGSKSGGRTGYGSEGGVMGASTAPYPAPGASYNAVPYPQSDTIPYPSSNPQQRGGGPAQASRYGY